MRRYPSPLNSICILLVAPLFIFIAVCESAETNSIQLSSSELNVVIGNNEAGGDDRPRHRKRYNGIWSLSSIHESSNVFVPFFAGMNLEHFMDDLFMTPAGGDIFEPRNIDIKIESVGTKAVKLTHPPSPLTRFSSETTFALKEPNAVDFHFRATFHAKPRAGNWNGFFWASYIHGPAAPALHFIDASGQWSSLCADSHGGVSGANSVCHASVTDPRIGDPQRKYRDHSLAHSYSQRRFSVPLMYGRPGNGKMMLLFMFDQAKPLRITMSPTGGGQNDQKNTYNPAWDFQYIVPNVKKGQTISLRARLIYKPYQNRKEIETLYQKWRAEHD